MIKHGRKAVVRLLCAGAALAVMALTAGASEVFLLPVSNMLWRTAPSATFRVPVLFPRGASSATLVVTGHGYVKEYAGLAEGMFSVSFPAADSADAENVYDLALTFNDHAATTHHAKLAVVQGASTGAAAAAAVRTAGSRRWSSVSARSVLPVPAGVDEVSINGQAVDAGLVESPGWHLLAAVSGMTYDILLARGGELLAEAILQGVPSGFALIIR